MFKKRSKEIIIEATIIYLFGNQYFKYRGDIVFIYDNKQQIIHNEEIYGGYGAVRRYLINKVKDYVQMKHSILPKPEQVSIRIKIK